MSFVTAYGFWARWAPPGGHGRSGVSAPQRWIWASTTSIARSGPPGGRPAQQPARKRAGVLAVAKQDLAVDDRRRDAARPLHETARARGQVVHDLRHLGGDGRRIEDDEVGGHPLANEPAVGEAPERRRDHRPHTSRLAEG